MGGKEVIEKRSAAKNKSLILYFFFFKVAIEHLALYSPNHMCFHKIVANYRSSPGLGRWVDNINFIVV